jgi:hypothetical protein
MTHASTSSQSARRPGGASDKRARPPDKPTSRAKASRLFVSFWNLCLENLPLGLFSHRVLTAKEAKRLIDKARATHSLRGVSQDDLLAPYKKHEKGNHTKLCRVLTEDYEIALSPRISCLMTATRKARLAISSIRCSSPRSNVRTGC